MFVLYGREFAELATRLGKKADAAVVNKAAQEFEQATIKYGFDYQGGYFLRAYDAFSKEVGSSRCEEGKIFIEPQGFCTMARIGAKEGLGRKAMESSLKYLLDDWGAEIVYPPYSRYHVELGEISSYPQGVKENGAVFNHNNPWLTIALCKEGMKEEAFDLYKRNAPAYIEDKSDIHKTEPYVYSQMIAGPLQCQLRRSQELLAYRKRHLVLRCSLGRHLRYYPGLGRAHYQALPKQEIPEG
jgi:cellobiose phosphorylase